MTPDGRIVADLHQIVDLAAFSNDSVAQAAAGDRCARADLDIILNDEPAHLRNLGMSAGARLQNYPVANERIQDGAARAYGAPAADTHLRADDCIGTDHRAAADLRPCPDHRAGLHGHVWLQPGGRMNVRAFD